MREVRSPWLTPDEAAKYARVGKERMRALIKAGAVPSSAAIGADPSDPSCKRLVNTDDLDAFLRQREMGGMPGAIAALRYSEMQGVA